jgi:hypothetical protein
MSPTRRVPTRAPKHFRCTTKVIRYAGCLETASGIDDDARDDDASLARDRVFEFDGVRPRSIVPRRAYDCRAAARVCAQTRAIP